MEILCSFVGMQNRLEFRVRKCKNPLEVRNGRNLLNSIRFAVVEWRIKISWFFSTSIVPQSPQFLIRLYERALRKNFVM